MPLKPIAAPASYMWILIAMAILWIGLLAASASVGEIVYLVPFLLVGLLGAGAVFLGATRNSTGAFILLLAFVIFVPNISFQTRDLGSAGLNWQNGLKLMIWIGLLVLLAVKWRQFIPLLRNPLVALASLFIIVALSSAAWSEVPAFTAASALGNVAYLGFAGLMALHLDERTILRVLLWTLLAYIATSVIGGIFLPNPTWLAPSVEETSYRLQGFAGHPNVLAQQIGLLLLIALISYRMELIGGFLSLGIAALCTGGILATGSRTTLAATVLTMGLVWARNSRAGIPLVLITVFGIAVLLAIFATGEVAILNSLLAKISRTGSIDEIMTFTGRTELWSLAWDGILEKPFLGWGYNGIEDYFARGVSTTFYGDAVNAHNELIQSMLSIGIIGTAPMIAWILVLIFRFFKHPDPIRDLIIIFWLLMGLFEVEIFTTPVLITLVIFWIFVRESVKPSRPDQSINMHQQPSPLPSSHTGK